MATVVVQVEVIGVEVGHWCNICLLSSGMRVWYVTATGPAITLRSVTGCRDEDHDDVELVEQPTTVWPKG